MTSPALDPRRLRVFIFDLDGTLIDSKLDLAHSVNATREHFGLATLPHETIFSFIGDGARTLIQRALEEGTSEQQVEHRPPLPPGRTPYRNEGRSDPGIGGGLSPR